LSTNDGEKGGGRRVDVSECTVWPEKKRKGEHRKVEKNAAVGACTKQITWWGGGGGGWDNLCPPYGGGWSKVMRARRLWNITKKQEDWKVTVPFRGVQGASRRLVGEETNRKKNQLNIGRSSAV